MGEWKEILSYNDQQLSDEELLKYLDNSTSDEEKFIIEKKLAVNIFESDAIDGLQQINNSERLKNHVWQLNQRLHQQLLCKNHRVDKRQIKYFQWLLLTLLVVLFVCVVSYFLIHLQSHKSSAISTPSLKFTL